MLNLCMLTLWKAEKAREEVNEWFEKRTNGLIKEILRPGSVSDTTRLIFANAVYFKGTWSEKFDADLTSDADFHLSDGTSVRAPFMTSRKSRQCVSAFNGFKVLKLPYHHGRRDSRRFSMYIYLPNARDGLPSLAERVCSQPGFVERYLPHREVRLDEFCIPKFKVEFEFEASRVLRELGVVGVFEIGGMRNMVEECLEGELLCVDGIRHRAVVEVDEEGAEAGGVAVVRTVACGPRYRRLRMSFVADRPFLFVVREDTTGLLLFVGQMLDPCAG